MVEFALIAPVLFVIFLGVFEMGRLMAYWIAMQQGAQEAARVGSIPSKTVADVVAAAQNHTGLIGAGLSECTDSDIRSSTCTDPAGGTIVVACAADPSATTPDGDCDDADNRVSNGWIRVEITYPFQPVPLVYPFGKIQLYSWAQLRVE